MTTIATLNVERITPTGEGVASLDGSAVFVRGALPGERVRAKIVHLGKVTRAEVVEVLEASPERVTPACPHAKRCGGCDLMHASMDLQRQTRHTRVVEQLGAVCAELPEPLVHTPTDALGYRSRARLQVHGQPGRSQVGYMRSRSHKMAAIDSCAVLRPELAPAIDVLAMLTRGSRGGGDARAALNEGGKLVLDLRWTGQLDREVFARADAAHKDGTLGGIQIWEGAARVPATFGDPRSSTMGCDGKPLWIRPGGFAQASEEGGRVLAERVGALAGLRPGGLTVELFAGSGTLTIAALPFAERYVAVERDADAVEMLRENLALRGLSAKSVAADAESFELKRPLATVILDPPRAGAAGACAAIAKARPRQVIYVSCNPSTLARDLGALSGYRVEQLEIVELFPQTSHVETIVRLVRD